MKRPFVRPICSVKKLIAVSFLILGPIFPFAIRAQEQVYDPAVTQVPDNAQFKNWWISLSVDIGMPYSGMTQDPYNYPKFDLSGNGTFWYDLIANLSFGITPIKVSSRFGVGFSLTASAARSYGNNQEVPGYWDLFFFIPIYVDPVMLHYSGTWIALSPMLSVRFGIKSARFRIKSGPYVNIGIGPSLWKYITMSYEDINDDIDMTSDFPSMKGATGITLATLLQINWAMGNLEIGTNGPDLFLGMGISI
jgi:hypothetical protein